MDPSEGITYWESSDKPDFPPLYDSVNGNEKQNKPKLCQQVNRELLSFKAFYFFFYGAIGSLFPFLSLYYKHLWLSASQAGLLVGLRPIVQAFAAPLWAILADKCNIKKVVLLVGLVGWLLTRSSILLVSPGEKPLSCVKNSTTMEQMRKRSLENPAGRSSLGSETSKEITERRLKRSAAMHRKRLLEDNDFERVSRQQNRLRFSTEKTSDEPLFLGSEESSHPTPSFNESTSRPTLKDTATKDGNIKKELDSSQKTVQASVWGLSDPKQPIKTWYTFVLIFMITMVGDLFSAPAQTMANTATLQALKADTHKYGFQRCFGSIGWGFSAFVVGMLVSLNHDESLSCEKKGLDDVNYTPCFYAFGILMLIALVVALFFKFDEARRGNQPVGLCKNIRQELDFLTCFILFVAFLSGFNMGFIQTFLFWHLHSLGGTQKLFSIITAFNAIGEMIGFLLSVKLIEKFGHLKVMSIGFAAYAVRLLVCGLVKNPWLVLTVEMLKAFTSSGIWASLLSFVGVSVSSGATLLSLVHMVYWGLGYGGGGMLGGVLMQYIGASKVFVGLAVASFLNVLVILLIINLNCCPKRKSTYLPLASDGEEEEQEEGEDEQEEELES